MSYNDTITIIDIWSSKIRTVIWKTDTVNKDNFHILWIGICNSNAIRKWNILDMDEFKANVDKSLEEAEKMSGTPISGAFLSFNSSAIDVIDCKWIISVSWEEVTRDDIERVLDMAKWWVDLNNKEVLKIIPQMYCIDGQDMIKNPAWMLARKLEVRANMFIVWVNIINNIKKAIEWVGIEVLDIYPNLIASPEWVLSRRQKELWVVCIDIWSATTWVTVYEEGSLIHSAVLPLGWDSVTSDIALGLRVSIDVAEKIKLQHAELLLNAEDEKDYEIDLSTLSENEEWSFSKNYLRRIDEARYDEIFYFIREELKRIWKDWMLPEWAVFVWGGCKIKWFVPYAKEKMRLPVMIGLPSEQDQVVLNDPVFVPAIGTMILANNYSIANIKKSFNFKSIGKSFTNLFHKISPK